MTFVSGEEGESSSPLEWIPIPAVLAGLESEDWTVRAEAAGVLGQIGSSEAVDESTKALAISALKMALKDERDYVREMADQAINRIQKKQSVSSPLEITIAPRETEAIDVGKLGPETVVNHEGHVMTIVRKVGKDIFSTGSTLEGSFVALEKGQPRYFDQSGTGSDTRTKDAVLKIVSAEDGKFNVENLFAAGDVRVVSSSPVEITVDKLKNVVIDVGKTISVREATWKGDRGIKVQFSDQRDGSKTPYPATVWVEEDPSTGVLATNVSSQGLFFTLEEKVGKDETAHFFGADGQRLYDSKNAVLKIVRQDGYIHITNHAAPGMTFSASSPVGAEAKKKKYAAEMLKALGSKDTEVRVMAARALGAIGGSRAINALTKALKDKYYYVREEAARAREEIQKKQSSSSPLMDIQEAKKAIQSFFENRDISPKVQIERILGILKLIIEETPDEELREIDDALSEELLMWGTAARDISPEVIKRLEDALDRLSSDTKGGIDLNPGNMDMQTNYGGERIQLPMPDIPLESIQIDGLVPVILRVAPVVNLPLLLGLKSEGEGGDDKGDVFGVLQQPAEAPRRFKAKEVE